MATTADLQLDLSADDISSRLTDSIRDEFLGGEARESEINDVTRAAMYSLWVVDVYPLSSTFVYRGPEGDYLKRGYSLDPATGSVSLIGGPTEVERITSYVPTRAGFSLSMAAFAEDGDDVFFEGEIFRAGSYPDKGVEADANDLVKLAKKAVGRIAVKIQHIGTAFDQALEGFGVDKVRAEGDRLFGRVRLPKWVKSALGEEFAVSVGLALNENGRPEEITELSIVDEGRVPTARLVEAFAAFAGARNNKTDQEALQTIHDLAVKNGATCSSDSPSTKPEGKLSTTKADPSGKADQPKPMNLTPEQLEKAKTAVLETGLTEVEVEALFGRETPGKTATETPGIDPVFEARLQELERNVKVSRDRELNAAAAAFAKDVVYAKKKALPSEIPSLEGLFLMAVKADGKGEAQFSESGAVVEGENVALLKGSIESRKTLAMFETSIPNQGIVDPQSANAEAIRASVMAATPTGKAALELKKEAAV